MKQITNEVRAKIFALYFNQNVLKINGGHGIRKCIPFWGAKDSYAYLELTDLKHITDEHAIEVANIFHWNYQSDESKIHQVKNFLVNLLDYHSTNISANEYFELIDFLRSNGYAISAQGYSVQDLIDNGVFKIKEQ